jgi:predicted nucleic acid-binding protein
VSSGDPALLVLDTTALINFRGEGLFGLLGSLTGLRVVTTAYIVENELVYDDTREAVSGAVGAGSLQVVDLESVEELGLWQELSTRLARGEASALAFAHCRGQAFLTDDLDCYTVALSLLGEQRCYRSCRLLVEALHRRLLGRGQAEVLFARWRSEEFRMPWTSLEDLWLDVFPNRAIPE